MGEYRLAAVNLIFLTLYSLRWLYRCHLQILSKTAAVWLLFSRTLGTQKSCIDPFKIAFAKEGSANSWKKNYYIWQCDIGLVFKRQAQTQKFKRYVLVTGHWVTLPWVQDYVLIPIPNVIAISASVYRRYTLDVSAKYPQHCMGEHSL